MPARAPKTLAATAACAALLFGAAPAAAAPVSIVAVGASNTSGWGVGEANAYPARLEAMLRARGLDVQVVNSGIPFETTNGMLARIDESVPDGTRIAIIQPGANDLRFLGTRAQRSANIQAMVARLCARHIAAIVYDPVFASDEYQWDFIHLNQRGHDRAARDLAPRVAALLGRTRGRAAGARCETANLRLPVRIAHEAPPRRDAEASGRSAGQGG